MKTPRKILIVMGHPGINSFCSEMSQQYLAGAMAASADIKTLNLADLTFNLNLGPGYRDRAGIVLEPDIKRSQELLIWADHYVFVFPVWWGGLPALMKGWVDRVFLPGFAFKYRKNSPFWDKLLVGKTARVIMTMKAPVWYYRLVYGAPVDKSFVNTTLKFCGVGPVQVTRIGDVEGLNDKSRQQLLEKMNKLGMTLK